MFAGKGGLAIVLALLCLGGRVACAQSAPVRYWTPGSLFGFGASLADGQKADTYGDFPSFDASGGSYYQRNNLPNGWFVGNQRSSFGLGGFNQAGAFGSLYSEGVQLGYNFKGAGGSPVTFFAGFDSLKYNPPGIGGPIAPFSTNTGTMPGYGYAAHAGVTIQPTSNLSLSFGASFVQQQPERIDSDINSPLLPGQSPIFVGGRR
ncbi:hypothetical protein ACFFWD_04795 [Bradyrhizobium erythrophlei]|uniref:hypothetical protein n=1 Tax=Bradyrhizobium erythrophlei TaxID=1437360 RepID=UPI0035EE7851